MGPLNGWVPNGTVYGIFFLCELPLVIAASLGACSYYRRHPEVRSRILWVALMTAYTVLVWGYRAALWEGNFHGFHYLFLFTAWASIFFGHASDAVIERILPLAPRHDLALTALWLFLFHNVAIWAAIDTRFRDLLLYKQVKPFHDAYSSWALTGKGRIAIIGANDFFQLKQIHGLYIDRPHEVNSRKSLLAGEYERHFVLVRKSEPQSVRAIATEAPDIAGVVVFGKDGMPQPAPSPEWLGPIGK
jgi:hypothetical protein